MSIPKESGMMQQSGYVEATQDEARKSELPTAIERLVQAIEILQSANGILSARLAPVARPQAIDPKIETVVPEAIVQTEYAEKINNLARSVEMEHSRITELTQRLEV